MGVTSHGDVRVTDGTNAAAVTAAGSVQVTHINLSNQAGTWAYYAGSSGTVNVAAGQRVIGIAVHCTTAGSFTINGGQSCPVPAASSVQITPMGNVVAPSIVLSGTDSYFIEVVS